MATPVHRHTDKRSCGATTRVKGQSTVYVNNKLASVQGDENTHRNGALRATVNDGTVYINNKKVVLKGSLASGDKKKGRIHKPTKQKAVGASGDVFACGGGSGATNEPAAGPDPTREELYGTPGQADTSGAQTTQGGGSGGAPAGGGNTEDVDPANMTPGTTNVPADRNASRNVVPPETLANDEDFQRELAAVKSRYPGLTDQQIYQVIQGESSFNSRAVAPSGATGLFQFMPATANELGYSTAQIQNMTPAQQMNVYGKYLDRWDYNPQNELGIMQAAPAYANRSGSAEIYKPGSAAYRQNPAWRGSDGRITVDSINQYYRNQS